MMGGGRGGGPMGARFERPKDARHTILRLLGYLKGRELALVATLFLMLISSGGMIAGNYFLKPLINNYILPGDFAGLGRALMILAGIYLAAAGASYLQSRLMMQIAYRTTNVLRQALFVKMQTLPLRTFDTNAHGDLMSRFTNDLDTVQLALEQSMVQLIANSLTFVGAVGLMIYLSPILALATFVVLGLMFFVSGKIAGQSRRYFRDQQRALGDVNGYVEELVDGLKVVKVFNHEAAAIAEFERRNEEYRRVATEANFYAGVVMPIIGNLNNVAFAFTATIGGVLAVVAGFDIGSLAAFLQTSRQVGMPVQQITNQLNTILAALAGAERVFDLMDQPPEVDRGDVTLVGMVQAADGTLHPSSNGTRPSHWAWQVPQADGSSQYVELKGDVRFHDVTFGYEPDKGVLCNLSLFAKPGQKIALVGSTGAGKTTIANLLTRYYDVQEGSITYDGIDIQRICKADLRQSLGMVQQDIHLFSGTILENIRFGRLGASDAECIAAAERVNADSFIKRLPDGYETFISADGGSLSQGQRQMLAIARAAVADPPVMILDEATSSIDTRTEQLIERGMDALMEGRTVFVIAHRLSTVRHANAILVLEGGEVIERGDHEDLLAQGGRYYQLYTGQYQLS
jgi:ATP-binding cassette subfamily B protein